MYIMGALWIFPPLGYSKQALGPAGLKTSVKLEVQDLMPCNFNLSPQ